MIVQCTVIPLREMQLQVTTTEGIRIWKPMWLIMIGQRRSDLIEEFS